jgi:hypothetical protein
MARPVLADADVLIDYAAGTGAAGQVERLIHGGRHYAMTGAELHDL